MEETIKKDRLLIDGPDGRTYDAVTLKLPSTIKASLSGNATSATTATTAGKLSTSGPFSLWGNQYWNDGKPSGTISGNMSEVGNIAFSASGKNIGGMLYFNSTSNQLRVATSATASSFVSGGTTTTPKFYVDGNIGASQGLWGGFMELYHATPYIDFHFGSDTSDYTTRTWTKTFNYTHDDFGSYSNGAWVLLCLAPQNNSFVREYSSL